ncbi:MAG: HAD family hydrolase [Halolamina sp.]
MVDESESPPRSPSESASSTAADPVAEPPGDAAVDAVFFDLDGTVWEYRRAASEVLTAAFDAVGVDPRFTAAEYVDRIPKFGDEVDTEAELRRRCFADVGVARGLTTETAHAVADAYTRERDYRNVRLLPGAREAVATMGERYAVAAVTNNGPEAQRPKLDELGLADAFEHVVYAGALPERKPHPLPFETALEAVDADPGRTVHVGNSLVSDVAGAARLGMRSVYVPDDDGRADGDGGDAAPTYRLDSLAELVDPPWE